MTSTLKLLSAFAIAASQPFIASAKEIKIPASDESIRYMGRILWDDSGCGSFTFPGTSALFNFNGTSLKMETSPRSGKFVIEIDNDIHRQVVFSATDSIMTLAENLPDTLHNVRITYAIEGYEKNPHFRSFIIDGEMASPTEKPDLKIEFIGNSITCGYGIEDNNPENHFSYDTENHTLSYAYRTARALNADFNIVARSGIGVYRNFGSPREGDIKTMPLEYDYTLLYNHDHKWNHSAFMPDIVCINLGTNDTSEGNYDISLYESHYRDFLSHLREKYPDAKFVLLTGSMMQGKELEDVKGVLDRLASECNSTYRFDMSPQTGELGYGADYHPSERQAEKMAEELTAYLSALIKPESH